MDFLPAKKFGFGMMRMPVTDPSDQSSVDIDQVCKMVDTFIDNGFTYFDTAWMYNGFASEDTVKKVLTSRYDRDKFTLATKLHGGFIQKEEDRDKIFEKQLEKTGAGYFDYYLIHGIDEELLSKYEKLDCFNWLLDKKEKGLVKHAGFSFHDSPEVLDKILTDHPEMEFVQLQINYLDWSSEWVQARGCYEVARKHDKPVIIMEPVKGGTLADVPEEGADILKKADPKMSVPSWAIRCAASLGGVMMVLSGMSNMEQMTDNISYMKEFIPLTEEEKKLCFKVADVINAQIAIPCTGCSYCTGGCPMQIAIPQYFSLYNEDMREDLEKKGWTMNFSKYNAIGSKFGRAGECIGCGQCEGVCPQHLPIVDDLRLVAAHFEG